MRRTSRMHLHPETGAVMMRHTTRVGASSETKLNVPLDLPESGDYMRQYAVFDSAGAVIAASRVLRARTSILDCLLVSPAFRGNIQSKDPEKEILVQGAVGIAGQAEMESGCGPSAPPKKAVPSGRGSHVL